jgi:NAD(P)-dependent dehydrogenase (short-subunit alcohol dehydrogenase family)
MNPLPSNPYSLADKRILITGASSGIGRSCAVELSRLGAQIILVARSAEQLEETRGMMQGSNHHVEQFDLTCGEKVVTWMKNLCVKTGAIDGIVHSAGVFLAMPIRATTQEMFEKIISTNLTSSYFLAKAFRQKGVKGPKGSMVLIGSVMSFVGQPALSAYCSSKSALIALSKSLALEFASEGIRVNVVAPGSVATPMAKVGETTLPEAAFKEIEAKHPLGIGAPEDIAYACGYLLSEASRWVTGTTLVVDGGYTAA